MKRLLLALLLLTACKDETAIPLPVALTADSTGYFCQMDLLEHPGPKGQIHLATFPGVPLFFSQVRDAVVYLRMPEQADTITAFYVNDMGAAVSWEEPGAANWIAADAALYVIGSSARGGMEAPEFVPFSDPVLAARFAKDHGGQVFALADIPASAIEPAQAVQVDEADLADRLRALSDQTGG
jgi:copper chaperone NosL